LKNGETLRSRSVPKHAKENHYFTGEVSESGQTDGGESGQTKRQSRPRHHFSQAAKIGEL
jgi:hypothetical protein